MYKKKCITHGPDENYGLAQPLEDLLPNDEVKKKKNNFLKSIALTTSAREQIELETRNQCNSQKWFIERRNRLTASNFGKVCKMRPTTSCKRTVYDILYGHFTTQAMEYGKITEDVAKKKFEILTNLQVMNCGLFIDADKPYLAASPGKYDLIKKKMFDDINLVI